LFACLYVFECLDGSLARWLLILLVALVAGLVVDAVLVALAW
jgi:hypothetical protein